MGKTTNISDPINSFMKGKWILNSIMHKYYFSSLMIISIPDRVEDFDDLGS